MPMKISRLMGSVQTDEYSFKGYLSAEQIQDIKMPSMIVRALL